MVETRGTIPVLETVRVIAGNGTMALTGTDMEISLEVELEAATAGVDLFAVSAKRLAAVIKQCGKGDVVLDLTGGDDKTPPVLDIAAGAFTARLLTLPVADFPSMAARDLWPAEFTISASALFRLFNKVAFAIIDGGNPLLPQRHLLACRARWHHARGCD